jgi:hypothetical protein
MAVATKKSTLFRPFKYKDVEYNNLSEKTREKLESLIPESGEFIVRRTQAPYTNRLEYIDRPGSTPVRFDAHLMGARRIESWIGIQDPYSGEYVQLVNLLRQEGDGQIVEVSAGFQRNTPILALNLADFHQRQTAAMLYLMITFKDNILDGGNPKVGYETLFERLDLDNQEMKMLANQFSVAELIVRLQNIEDLRTMQVLAKELGHETAETETGVQRLKGFVRQLINNPATIEKARAAFAVLDVLEIEGWLRTAWDKGVIIKHDDDRQFRYKHNNVILWGFDLNADNQFYEMAKWLANRKNDKNANSHYEMIKKRMDFAAAAKEDQDLLLSLKK